MKIAYLVLAYNNFDHLQRLINALSTDNTCFYIHIDKRIKNVPKLTGRLKFIKRINSYWSTWNCVKASINLMKEAYKDGNDYFVLISGTDYPIVSNEKIEQKLIENGNRMWLQKWTLINRPASYYKYFHFIVERRPGIYFKIEKVLRKFIRKKPDFELYAGGTWFSLDKEYMSHILQEIKNGKWVKFFKHSRYPEESFFQTIVGNSKFKDTIKEALVYTDWSSVHHPEIITKDHIPIFKNSIYLFARKFEDKSTEVIDLIDKELRQSKNISVSSR